jgi:hypothetical protein
MISDGIENCLQYLNNFNPEKSNNPFAYFYTNNLLCIYKKNTKRKETSTLNKE